VIRRILATLLQEITMSSQELHDMLARLHAELQRAHNLDDGDRELLRGIAADFERLGGAESAPAAPADSAHLPRLEALAVKFESGHPALAGSLRDFIDALARVGM
jgi:hypothetical protein